MGLHARMDAKASTIFGLATLAGAVAALSAWGIVSFCFLVLAGVLAISLKPHNVRGLSGLAAKLGYLVLVFLSIVFAPVNA
jgi:hypothetical protein